MSSPANFINSGNFFLKDNDIIYVNASGTTRWNRVISQFFPFSTFLASVNSLSIVINKDKPQICIVCFANFCRSPVAEIILNNLYGNEYNFFSAGIQPLPKADMDLRSQSFLSSREYNFSIHNPKKINNNLLVKLILFTQLILKY